VSGEVIEVNGALKDAPEQVNTDPHGAWMVAIRMDSGSEADDLLSAAAYADLVE
jgi:glycine cleavage system H protein